MVMKAMETETKTIIANSELAFFGQALPKTVPNAMAQKLLDQFFLSRVKENFVSGLDPETAGNIKVKIEEEEDDVILF